MRRLIHGGTLILPEGAVQADLLIDKGSIQAILYPGDLPPADIDEWVDVTGQWVFPGVIDCHVHFETGTAHVDDLPLASRAAALGGTTTMIGHVWSPTGDLPGEIARQRDLVAQGPLDVAFHGICTPGVDPSAVVPALVDLGVTSFKFFMVYRDRGLGMDDGALYRAFRQVRAVGGVALVHAEVGDVIAEIEAERVAAGLTTMLDYAASRPESTEVEAIRRVIWLAQQAGVALYLVHVSTGEGLECIVQAQGASPEGPPIYAETCPKYLLLDEGHYATLGGLAKVAPPLRSAASRRGLVAGLLGGRFDALGSDHSPYAKEQKVGSDFRSLQTGAPGVQTFFSALLSGVADRGLAGAVALARSLSLRPAQVFGLFPRKGWLGSGADADLVVVDPGVSWQVTAEWGISRTGYSLYDGQVLRGKPLHSMVRGRWVLRDGALTSEVGGEYLARRV